MEVVDQLKAEAEQYIPEGYDPQLYKIRHSAAHVMAQAVLERFPGAKPAIGPPIQDGFYYDFDLPRSPDEDDIAWIEERMKAIIKGRHPFQIREVTAEEAQTLFADDPYKLELIEGLVRGGYDENGNPLPADQQPRITVYQHDTFVDLCRGPHVPHTGYLKHNAVKLMNIAGAYWRGDANKQQLTRIYGTAWRNKTQLDDYLERLELARQRDHRKLGRELGLFTFSKKVGPGLPLWLPKGALMRQSLTDFLKQEQLERGYLPVITPHIGRLDLYKTSGHYPYYSDSQFPAMIEDEEQGEGYLLKPMNCPHHIEIYADTLHSYRDLPVRLAEFGTVYRYEQSGELGGLTRVRGFTQDDAHIFCTPDQVKDEFKDAIDLSLKVLSALSFDDYKVQLSLRDPNDKEKYVGTDAQWEHAEQAIREAAAEMNLDAVEALGEAAFYGPKVDFMVRDALGREWQLGTVQLDYNLPERFDLTYVGSDDKRHQPAMIHRAPFGSLERFIGVLIEHCGGAFPAWLAPVQARILPITDGQVDYARDVEKQLRATGLRVEVDDRNEKVGYKIREAQLQKVPYMLIVGKREMEHETVAVRLRTEEDLGAMPVAEFLQRAQTAIDEKRAL